MPAGETPKNQKKLTAIENIGKFAAHFDIRIHNLKTI